MARTDEMTLPERILEMLIRLRTDLGVAMERVDSGIQLAVGLCKEPGCAHKNRREFTTMGATERRFVCLDCKEVLTEPFAEAPVGGKDGNPDLS